MSNFLFAVSRITLTASQRAQNLGFPFDRDLAARVAVDMRAARLDDESLIADQTVRVIDGWAVREHDGRVMRRATAEDRRLSRATGGRAFVSAR